MLVTELGIVILLRLAQPKNADFPILVTPCGITTSVRDLSFNPVIVMVCSVYSYSNISSPFILGPLGVFPPPPHAASEHALNTSTHTVSKVSNLFFIFSFSQNNKVRSNTERTQYSTLHIALRTIFSSKRKHGSTNWL